MQASIESTGNLERRLTFSLPEDRLQTHISGRLGEIARTTRIKGFRPGKVPAKVIEQRFGQQVRSEAVDGLLRETFDAALREHELRIAGTPRIDKGEGELSFVATVELVPDFGDVDVSKLTVVRHTAEINDADIEQMITAIVTIIAATSLMTIADTVRTGSIADFSRPSLPKGERGKTGAELFVSAA